MSIFPVPPKEVGRYWGAARKELDKAFEQSEADTAAAHLAALQADQEQLWHIAGAAWAITRVVAGKRGRILEFVALGGHDMPRWKADFFQQAESWARRHGCVRAVFTGRKGWAKALPDYRTARISMIKEL